MNIYLDMDDVLCDTAGAYSELLAREFQRQVEFEQIHSFNLQQSFNLDDEENRRLFALAHEHDFITGLRPIDGMQQVLRNWRQNGATISIVTGRHTSAYHDSLAWLEEHDIPYDSFTMVDKYGWPDTDPNIAISLSVMASRRYDVSVEDSPEMATYLDTEMAVPVLLFDRPWNRRFSGSPSMKRCLDWGEIEEAVSGVEAVFVSDRTYDS